MTDPERDREHDDTGDQTDTVRENSGSGTGFVRKLVRVMGWKGPLLLLVLLGATALRSALPGFTRWGIASYAVAAVVLGGLLWTRTAPLMGGRTDVVGLSIAGVAAVAGLMRATGLPEPWWSYGALGSVVLAATVLDYWLPGERSLTDGWQKRDLRVPEILKVDLTGMVVVESLLIYGILLGAGWEGFATSPYLGGILFYFGASVFAIAAGYSALSRESARRDRDYELHEFLLETLIDLQGVDDDTLQRDLAGNLRTVADRLDGAALPSIVNDGDGPVPLVLPTREPVKLYRGRSVGGLVAALAAEDLTGYAVTDDGDVYLARNGELVKCYADGTWSQELDDRNASAERALLYATSHGLLNLVDTVTPPDYGEGPGGLGDEADEVTFDSLVEQVTATPEETEKPFSVGGRDVDMREMFERADDFLRNLTEK